STPWESNAKSSATRSSPGGKASSASSSRDDADVCSLACYRLMLSPFPLESAAPSGTVPLPNPPRIALVLPGGGARAAFQAGVLARLGEAGLLSRVRILTGVSAGAINAAYLANHRHGMIQAASELASLWSHLETPRVLRTSPKIGRAHV